VQAPSNTFRLSRPPTRYFGYLSLSSNVYESEPSTFKDATGEQVWRDSMIEEYSSITSNDVLDVVPRLEGKYVVTSRLIYKIKMLQMAVSRSKKQGSWREGSPRRRVWIMRRHSHPSPNIHILEQFCPLLQRWGGGYIGWM